tara:strand:- start:38737 stop:39612 length:876 start_codon:yes stop_codon:yes gene_type:complete
MSMSDMNKADKAKAADSTASKVDALFKPITETNSRRGLKVLVWGEQEVGKTYFGLSFPEPIYVISTEFGVSQLQHHFPDKDIRIMECSEPYTDKPQKSGGATDEDPFAIDPIRSLEKVELATEALKDVEGGTIIVDSISDIWSWLGLWLHYNAATKVSKSSGKEFMMRTEWQHANAKYRWLVMRLLSRPCHVVFTSRSGAVYDASGNLTNQTKAKAQGESTYYVDISVHVEKRPMPIMEGGKATAKMQVKRMGTIEKCRFNSVNNLQVEDITFDSLKKSLEGEVPKEVFGV